MARVTLRANGRCRTPAATPNNPSASHPCVTGRGASIPLHGNAGRTFTALKRIFCRPSKPSRNRFRERPAVEQVYAFPASGPGWAGHGPTVAVEGQGLRPARQKKPCLAGWDLRPAPPFMLPHKGPCSLPTPGPEITKPVFPRWTPPGASAATPAGMLPLGGTIVTIFPPQKAPPAPAPSRPEPTALAVEGLIGGHGDVPSSRSRS
jgi:hypothetical protein